MEQAVSEGGDVALRDVERDPDESIRADLTFSPTDDSVLVRITSHRWQRPEVASLILVDLRRFSIVYNRNRRGSVSISFRLRRAARADILPRARTVLDRPSDPAQIVTSKKR
jgi:hypothetical protein